MSASAHRSIRRMSASTIADAITPEQSTVSATTLIAAALEAQSIADANKPQPIFIEPVRPAGESTSPVQNKAGKFVVSKDRTTVKTITTREYPLLSMEQARTVLSQHDKASFTVASACASIIASEMIATSLCYAAATDNKGWKALKASIEASYTPENPDLWGFTFPQQWENYFSAVRGFLKVGGQVSDLLYRNNDNADCVRTMQWLRTEASRLDTSPSTSKVERAGDSLSNLVISLTGGENGKSEIVAPGELTVDPTTAKYLLDVAEATLGTTACHARLEQVVEPIERTLSRLLASYSASDLVEMIQNLA